jgi:N-acetylglucosamine-6-sulfatase
MSNLLVVTMDDMRFDELRYMPNVRRLLCGKGTTFTGCRANVPLCSPARTGIITGQYSKDHGCEDNGDPTDWNDSVFEVLNDNGYRVGGIGKMVTHLYGAAIKPGFDYWRALQISGTDPGYGIYNDNDFDIDDGTSTTNYTDIFQDHLLARFGIDFVTADYTTPWCLWYCPTTPHWPFNNPPNHDSEWTYREFPVTLESDVSDKPSWIQSRTAPDTVALALLQADQKRRLRELLAADDAIGAMVNTIYATGQADDTTILFTSDNGNMLGEHRLYYSTVDAAVTMKNTPYDPSMHVPLIAAGPGFTRQTVTQPTNQQDITATMLDIANESAVLPNQAGVSLVDIAATPASYTSRQLLHRRVNTDSIPDADAITTATRKLIRYDGQVGTDEFEMYDLDTDPDELTNVANVGGRLTERNTLEASLDALLA